MKMLLLICAALLLIGVAGFPDYGAGRNGYWATFWTSETFQSNESYTANLIYDETYISFAASQVFNGYPVRCIKE